MVILKILKLVKISYEGGFYDDEQESGCGVKAVENIIASNYIIEAKAKKKQTFSVNWFRL